MSTSDADEDTPAVVLDLGTGMLKAGFAGDDGPRVVFRNLIGTPKCQEQMVGLGLKDHYMGDEAERKRGILRLNRPMEHGVVTDWDAMERLWQTAFDELKVNVQDCPVLLTDRPLNPTANREMMAQLMFEKFNVPAFYVMTQGVLSLFASGRGAGVIVDVGEGVSSVMPIDEGLTVRPHAIQRVNTAGRDLTDYLQRVMLERGYSVSDSADLEVVREIKEELCYVADDYKKELSTSEVSSTLEKSYELPDGMKITLNDQRFRVPETLFQPSLLGRDQEGIQELVYKSINQCDIDSRSHFYCNIILCGGSTMFPGFGERLQKEVSALAPATMKVKVVQPPERKYSVWIGGSILASLSTFQSTWITKEQYEEHGPSIVLKKCS